MLTMRPGYDDQLARLLARQVTGDLVARLSRWQ
jgi:hypothetical protein